MRDKITACQTNTN